MKTALLIAILCLVATDVVINIKVINTRKEITKLEEKIAYYDTLFNTRMTVERDRFDMLSAEVGWHSTFWVQRDPWTSVELDKYRNYREAWTR